LRLCPPQPRHYALANPFPLELRQSRQNVKLQLARRRGAVNVLAQTDESHADMIQLFEHRHQVAQVASQSIQPPAHEHIKASTLGIREQRIEGRSSILRTADAGIDVFSCPPPASLAVAPKLQCWFSHVWSLVDTRA
jgi:hypothetical protein